MNFSINSNPGAPHDIGIRGAKGVIHPQSSAAKHQGNDSLKVAVGQSFVTTKPGVQTQQQRVRAQITDNLEFGLGMSIWYDIQMDSI